MKFKLSCYLPGGIITASRQGPLSVRLTFCIYGPRNTSLVLGAPSYWPYDDDQTNAVSKRYTEGPGPPSLEGIRLSGHKRFKDLRKGSLLASL